MPKTTVQKVIFGLLMSFFMVLAMEMYNTGLRNGGLTNAGILNALRELPLMFALCFLTSTVVGEPLAARLAARLAVPREWPFAAVLARSAMTVCVMCPAMSLWATVIFQQPGIELVPSWLQTVVCNFPMAFFWQIFFCGPLVRRLFRLRRIIWNLRIVVHNEFSFISVYIQSFLLLYPNICLSVNLICQNNRIFPY